MTESTKQDDRIHEVRRIFEENGFGNAELLEGWDGERLEELEELLNEEEFQTLLDLVQAWDASQDI